MLKTSVPVGFWAAIQKINIPAFIPTKPKLSMTKTKKKLAEFFDNNQKEREKSKENKENYPRMHQSVQDTAWNLLKYYLKNWGKPNATKCEIRITYGYLRKALNESCCIATLKNHINKLLAMFEGFIKEKHRGGLGLSHQNTACIVLVMDENIFQFEDERHNEAVQQDKAGATEYHRREIETGHRQYQDAHTIQVATAGLNSHLNKRSQTPSSIGSIFQNAQKASPKRE